MVIQQLENSIYLVISITISELDRITCFLWCYIITTAEAAAGSKVNVIIIRVLFQYQQLMAY